jgi:hypothetical protein
MPVTVNPVLCIKRTKGESHEVGLQGDSTCRRMSGKM